MKIENEIKYKVINHKELKNKIEKLDFRFVKKIIQEDIYFNPPHKDFSKSKKYYLRIRKIGKGGNFEYHIVKNDIQTNEWTVKVENWEILAKILEFLDFKKICVVNKERLVFQKGKIEIVMDKVKNLGNFIEIEFKGDPSRNTTMKLQKVASALNLSQKDIVYGVGYPDLLMNKIKNNDKS